MSVIAAIRRFFVELDEAMEHARTGHPPERVVQTRRKEAALRNRA